MASSEFKISRNFRIALDLFKSERKPTPNIKLNTLIIVDMRDEPPGRTSHGRRVELRQN